MKRINKFLNLSIVTEVIFLIIGILLCMSPLKALTWVSYIVGLVFIVDGIYLIVASSKNFGIVDMFLLGALFFILGVLLILNPGIVETIVPIILGIWLVVYGFVIMRMAIMLKTIDGARFIWSLILSVVTIFMGIVVISNPHIGALSIGLATGISLIVSSISTIADLCIFKKYAKELSDLVN